MGSGMKRKRKGNLLDFMSIAITILAMSIMVMAYLECTNLLMKKLEISQISRSYILKMETEGYLSTSNKVNLLKELQDVGLSEIDLSGTTMQPVSYGEAIYLQVKGKISGRIMGTVDEIWEEGFLPMQFVVEEQKMSTAKN